MGSSPVQGSPTESDVPVIVNHRQWVGIGPLGALVKNVFIHRKSSGYEKLLQGFLSMYGRLRSTDLHKQIQTLALRKKLPVMIFRAFLYTQEDHSAFHRKLTLCPNTQKILSDIRDSHNDKCKTTVLRNVTPCNPVKTNTRFEKTYTLRAEYKYSSTLNIEVLGSPFPPPPPRNIGKFLS